MDDERDAGEKKERAVTFSFFSARRPTAFSIVTTENLERTGFNNSNSNDLRSMGVQEGIVSFEALR